MAALLRFFTALEIWIYVLLGLVGLVYSRRLVSAVQKWRTAVFGLERNNVQRELNETITILTLIILLGLAEFVIVSFVTPSLPGIQLIPTPTIQVAGTTDANQGTLQPVLAPSINGTKVSTLTAISSSCIPGQLEFTDPKPGSQVQGKVTLNGTVLVPSFGFYKYEFAQQGDPSKWSTIQAGDHVRCSTDACLDPSTTEIPPEQLGIWDTSLVVPGDYYLRLVVTDNQGQLLPACVIPIRVLAP